MGENERLVQCALWRPGVRAGGEGAFLIHPGVLATCVRTPFQPAVGLRCCSRHLIIIVRIRAHSDPLASGRRHDSCGSAGRRSHRALHRRRSRRRMCRHALHSHAMLLPTPCGSGEGTTGRHDMYNELRREASQADNGLIVGCAEPGPINVHRL
jgi:hypothetical protein